MGSGADTVSINPWGAAAIVVLSLILSAFFSGAETALTAASRARMHALEKNGNQNATIVNRLVATRERFISAMLLGNQLVNIAASAVATSVLLEIFGHRGVVYATAIMTILVVVFAEVLPKTIAINYPDRTSLVIAPVVAFFVALFSPALAAVEAFVKAILRIVGLRGGAGRLLLSGHEELKGTVDLLHREGGVERTDRDMLGGILNLRDLVVSDVMIHRTKMQTINIDLPPEELVREILASPYTRLPLWQGEPENIIGVLHAKDMLRALAQCAGDLSRLKVSDIALDAWFVPDTTSLPDQLQAFLKRKAHFALVVDEYGVVQGLVTLEDILEEIVGDIKDEHDVAVQGVRPQPDGSVNVDGGVPVRDLNRVMGWDLPDEEATTIAGLVIHEARAIPETGQVFTFYGFRFEVLRKNRNRITVLRISPAAAWEAALRAEARGQVP
ncbi:MAG: HlyC/CorC family transporter [Methylobacteriaceae bacterium]|nr:HlyC/CorC family transporter [Methylobacteriaceae bacterium]MBV9703622.1 HlyC/CorC family transporter [Methylobacteriaceae bacterium]